jgi:hypothetical protein
MAELDAVRSLAQSGDFMAVVSVVRPDGTIHSSLVKAGVLDDPLSQTASVGMVIAGGARKLDYLRLAGRAGVTFVASYRWVSVEGPVRLVGPDDPVAGTGVEIAPTLRAVFRAAGGRHEDWGLFDQVMADERRCAVFISPATILPSAAS